MYSLPSDFCYLENQYSYRYAPSVVNTEFATGRSRNRVMEDNYSFIYSVAFEFTLDQFSRWEEFFYFQINKGVEQFIAPYWNGSTTVKSGVFRFLPTTYNVTENAEYYNVAFEMELVTRDFTDEDATKASFLSSGQTWQEFGVIS